MLLVFSVSGLYKSVFRYSGWRAMMSLGQSMVIYSIFFSTVFTVFGVSSVPRTVGVIQPIILFLTIAISRGFARFWLGDGKNYFEFDRLVEKVVIYGAGDSGRQLASAIAPSSYMSLVGFVDDDVSLQGRISMESQYTNPKNWIF